MGLRVIGGNLKGKKLFSVRGPKVRPTSDRLRESIFNILAYNIQKAIVLDLFSGTGALGIEAMSRGAEFAVFIDKSPEAVSVTARNIRSCKLEQQTKFIRWDIQKNLNCIQSFQPAFSLVFMDPPYNRDMIRPALLNLQRSGSLQKNASLIIEHAVTESIPPDLSAFQIKAQRRYGKTLVSFLDYVV